MIARGWWKIGLAALVLAAAGGRAEAVPNGMLVITDHAMDPKSKTFEKELMKAQKTALNRSGDVWHLYFVGYLKKAAGAAEVNLVFYDITGGKHEQVNAFPIGT